MGKNKKKTQRPPPPPATSTRVIPPSPPSEREAGPASPTTTSTPVAEMEPDKGKIQEELSAQEEEQQGGSGEVMQEVEVAHVELASEIPLAADEPENKEEETSAAIPASEEEHAVPEAEQEVDLFGSGGAPEDDDLFATIGSSHEQAESFPENQSVLESTSQLPPHHESKSEPVEQTVGPSAKNSFDESNDGAEGLRAVDADEEHSAEQSHKGVDNHERQILPEQSAAEELVSAVKKELPETVQEKEESLLTTEQHDKAETEDDLFGESVVPDASSFFAQPTSSLLHHPSAKSPSESSSPQKAPLTHAAVIEEGETIVKDDSDLLFGVSAEETHAHEFDIAVSQSHVLPDTTSNPPQPPPTDRDSPDLFGPSDAAEPDLFGNPLVAANNNEEEEDDLFAGVEVPEGVDELFGSTGQELGRAEDPFAAPLESTQEPDLFGSAEATGHDLDFITNPAPGVHGSTAPLNAAQPLKQRVEEMDLDAAGVPQGWVDEQGGWNWYTVEERLDVARGMFGDDAQVEAEHQGGAEEPAPSHATATAIPDPYAPQQITATNSYNSAPQPSYIPPKDSYNYAPAPSSNTVMNATTAYDPYKPSPAAASITSGSGPASRQNGYNTYQRQPAPAQSHTQMNPPTRTFSPYDPPATIVSHAHVFTPPAPVLTAEPSYQSSLDRTAAKPVPALTRMKTSTAYDPPMIPVTKATLRPASAAPVITPFAPSGLPGSVLQMSGVGMEQRVPPGVTSPPPTGPPRGPSRIASPANSTSNNTSMPPQRKPQSIAASVTHPATPNAYDPPVPAMPNRPASRVTAPPLGTGGPMAAVSPIGQHRPVALPPPPPTRSVSAMNAPPIGPPVVARSPQIRSQTQLPLQPTESSYNAIPSLSGPPAVNAYSPASSAYNLPPQQPASIPPSGNAVPPRASQTTQHGQPLRASSPHVYGLPAPNYQPPPFSRPSSSMKGSTDHPPAKDAPITSYPNENHARTSSDNQGISGELQDQNEREQEEEEQHVMMEQPSAEDDVKDPEGGAFIEEEEESYALQYSYAQTTSRTRPSLQQDTFSPPSASVNQRAPLPFSEAQTQDPYAPQAKPPNDASAAHASSSIPIRPAMAPYADYASDPYAPSHSQTTQSYMPTSSYQPPVPLTVPSSPAVSTNVVPLESQGHLLAKPPSVSVYDPIDALGQQNTDEDHLARASPAARRVPCVSFGPNGKLVVAFQRDPEAESSAHVSSLAYGDSSSGLPVHIRRLADSLPPLAEKSGTTQWPGPLLTDPQASKTSTAEKKKRDALNAFLTERIQEIESGLPYLSASGKDIVTRANQEATMLLYQVAQLMLKHDGKLLISDPAAHAELKEILPKVSASAKVATSVAPDVVSDDVGTAADMQLLSDCLLKGDPQSALKYATDHHMWSHALLLAAGIDSVTWTATVSAFVKATIQSAGADDSRAVLATAYNIYGKGGPAIVEQIPNGDLPTIWRNSLATIIASSKPNDATYVIALADKLRKQGLIEAAHLCYILSPMIVAWQQSRPDSPLSLIGSSETDQQTEATLISEIMEYAIWLRPVPKGAETFHGVPHLLQYKLNKAATLFAAGEAALSKRYCEAVIASLRLRKVPDQASQLLKLQLQNLLSQINGEEFSVSSAKGLPKPKLENLGSWFEGTLTKFIAGEESESGDSKTSGHMKKASSGSAGIGPFSHFSAITPETTPALPSRTMSSFDIPATAVPPPIPRSGSAMSYRSQPAMQPLTLQRPNSAMAYGRHDTRLSALSTVTSQADEPTGYGSSGYTQSGYAPASHGDTSGTTAGGEPQESKEYPSSTAYEPAQEQVHAVEIPSWGQSYTFEDTNEQPATDEASGEDVGSFINPMANFITPAASLHPSAAPTPPTAYQPRMNIDNIDDDDDDDLGLGNTSRKKKAVDSAESAPKASTPTSNYAPPAKASHTVETKTEEPERPKESPKPGATGGSWLGRLWGKGGTETPAAGPVRAKLGNESSMYYDKELKRWVTKGPGGQPEAPKAAPPPPRAASTSKPSTPAAPSPAASVPPALRPASAAPPAFGAGPARSQSATPAMSGLATPPTRPASSATVGDPPIGNALAPPPARRAGTAGKKSIRSRYVEIS